MIELGGKQHCVPPLDKMRDPLLPWFRGL